MCIICVRADTIFRMLPKKYGVPAVILAGMVAFSRLYLGVHYPGDVLGGFLVAVFTSTLAYHLVQAYCKKAKEQSEGSLSQMEEGIRQDACNSDHTGLSAGNGTSDSVVDPLTNLFL